MKEFPPGIDLKRVRVYPLAERQSLSAIDRLLIDPHQSAAACPPTELDAIKQCASSIVAARQHGASVMLLYGAHLIKNGAQRIVNELIAHGWVTHLATNGAGSIHDWELSFLGRTEESVRKNVATGTFGTWDETGRYIHLALMAGAPRNEGDGRGLGGVIFVDGGDAPKKKMVVKDLHNKTLHTLTP